ncbi:conserved Plasmodium protein, unknown function [Plasmodium sp. gorilla clade G2]|uniref:conserved Plasmodium protein, unknown function n=1 Tax=Plasmodium sp. gorilla clade G2 TaxID=880535 RepID=UPI000D22733C|nr:conserved Plasmodium protein, unknown function [Plasmodium sp. gorilla clade G2]SOV16778.1 conserved Plasmodium protein, unknown function [Plasmodium sp. gorilla clade G2]
MIYLEPLDSNDKKEDNCENKKINEEENNEYRYNCENKKISEEENNEKCYNCGNIFLSAKEKRDNEINKILKNMKKEERNLCFPLLDLYFLNKNFKYQNLKESLEFPNNVNEYINLNLLKKEIYPKDIIYQNDQNKKNEKTWIYNKLIKKGLLYDKKLKENIINKLNSNYNFIEKYDNIIKESDNNNNNKKNISNNNNSNILISDNFPFQWEKGDNIISTYNPIYNARDKIINDNYIASIPTIDIFYNSSKLLTIQTIFEPINHYIYLLRLLPKFSLPLYDSGILQYVCEDPILNDKLKGLELSYRLLVHDILFYAFFSYLSDLPFWAKPPIEILRIYNYESLYSFNDCESEHTERLVFHNIKSIIYNFSDTLNKIELLYPKNYYITILPNIYFKNIIDFLKSENFKLKKMIILLKGTNHMDIQKLNYIKSIFDNLRGVQTERILSSMDTMNDITVGGTHIRINKGKEVDTSEIDHDNTIVKETTQRIIEAMKKCSKGNRSDKLEEQMNTPKNKKNNSNKNNKKNNNNKRYNIINGCVGNNRNNTYNNSFDNFTYDEYYIEKGHNKGGEQICRQSIINNVMNVNDKIIMTNGKNDSIDISNINNNNCHIDNNYNIDTCIDDDTYDQIDNAKRQNNITLAFRNNNKKKENKQKYISSESSNSDDDTDDENIDGFFKTKKLKTTVYDKSTFSFSKFVNKIINYEKIIDYLNNDPQRQEKEDSRIKFFVKMLLFEKRYVSYDVNNDEINICDNNICGDDNNICGDDNNICGDDNDICDGDNNICDDDNDICDGDNINIKSDHNTKEGFFQSDRSEHITNVQGVINEAEQEITNTNSNIENIPNNVNDNVSNSSDHNISNLIQNFRRNYVSNNFLSFSRNVENEQGNNMNIENSQDNFTSITFNFN